MALVPVDNTGQIGVIKDLSVHELPINAWTDSLNVRFIDGYAHQTYGHANAYQTPAYAPQHIFPVDKAGVPYWIYTTASKTYAVTSSSGTATHTDITHATPLTGLANGWTSTLLSGIPIINAGNTTNLPAAWDLNLANDFVDLSNWPAATYCKALRSFKNYLVAFNITKGSTRYPYMVKWSHPADPGALPSSWDHTDPTKDAGEVDLADGYDPIVDGAILRDTMIIYKENSAWSMSYVGGQFIFSFRKLFDYGLLNKNCVVEYDGLHFIVARADVLLHDGNTAVSVLDKITRKYLFNDIDGNSIDKVFCFKNNYLNEIFVCYPSPGATTCDKALIYNYKDKTVSFRDLPDINHANFGRISVNLSGSWALDSEAWDGDLTTWQKDDFIPVLTSVLMASSDGKIYLLDSGSTFDGTLPAAFLERQGLSFGAPEAVKLVRGIRPRITGTTGDTILIKVGTADDPYADPTYTSMTHTIGSTIANDCLVSGRYIAIRFESGTAQQWRLDSYQIDVAQSGSW